MASQKQFTLSIINQDGIVYYGQAEVVFVPAEHDTVAVMAYHTPMIMKLGIGDLAIRNNRKTVKLTTVKSGIMYVGENEVSVLINT